MDLLIIENGRALADRLGEMLGYVCRDVASMLRYLPGAVFAGVPLAVLLYWLKNRLGRKEGKEGSFFTVAVFCVYVSAMVIITFLSRESGSRKGVDLELFSTWGINCRNNAYVVENVLLFIPYGYLLCRTFPRAGRLFRCALYGAVTSLGIETLQLVTQRGYFQIDDILTNILGMVIGYVLFRLVSRFRRPGAGGS